MLIAGLPEELARKLQSERPDILKRYMLANGIYPNDESDLINAAVALRGKRWRIDTLVSEACSSDVFKSKELEEFVDLHIRKSLENGFLKADKVSKTKRYDLCIAIKDGVVSMCTFKEAVEAGAGSVRNLTWAYFITAPVMSEATTDQVATWALVANRGYEDYFYSPDTASGEWLSFLARCNKRGESHRSYIESRINKLTQRGKNDIQTQG